MKYPWFVRLAVFLSAFVVFMPAASAHNRASASPDTVHLVKDSKSVFSIYIPGDTLTETAETLQHYIRQISGATLPILHQDAPDRNSIVFILNEAGTAFHEDGFRIQAADESIRFTAHTQRGLQNAVYTFLETYLGCRKYSVRVEVIPTSPTITLPEIDDTQIPLLSFRMQDFKDEGYAAWHKLSSLDEWGLFVHTFDDLVPPDVYFKDHPEYFSENQGVRVADGQLCLTNPDVLQIVKEDLHKRMRSNPTAKYWSVSQNDTYIPCDCEVCRAISLEEGALSGSILRFVNQVAEEFPDKVISTLAYQYSRRAPAITRPAANVNIMLCSIECDRSRPISENAGDDSFAHDVKEWGKLTHNIFLWDYVIQFRNLVSPYPNLHVLQPNMQFFVENGITAVFEQGLAEMHGEFAELRAYLLSKLLWDPYVDMDSVMTDFLNGYYSDGGPHIRKYIDSMHDALQRSGEGLSSFGYPFPSEDGYLSAAMIDSYRVIFNEAELAVQDQPVYLERVRTARLPLQYARLEQAKLLAYGDNGCFMLDDEGVRTVRPEYAALLDTFCIRCERDGTRKLWEHGIPPEEYHETTLAFWEGSTKPHTALDCEVALTTPASAKYHNGEATALTNGFVAWNDYHMHWLGFEGEDMEATIDLGEEIRISRIETAFLQDEISWIFLPVEAEFSVSRDGVTFVNMGTVPASLDPSYHGAKRVPAVVSFEPRTARYVRVKAVNMKQCPPWHKGAGGKAWIFCDEIKVY